MSFVPINLITIGIPYVTIGIFIRNVIKRTIFNNYNFRVVILVMSTLLFVVEILFSNINLENDTPLSVLCLAPAIFIFFVKYKVKTRIGFTIANTGKEHSQNLYLWHILIVMIILPILYHYKLMSSSFEWIITMSLTFLLSLALSSSLKTIITLPARLYRVVRG